MFWNVQEENLTINESTNHVQIAIVLSFRKRHAYLPTKSSSNCVWKLGYMHQIEKDNAKKLQFVFNRRSIDFLSSLENLFRIALAEALYAMKIEEGETLLQFQKEPGRPSSLGGMNKKTGLKRTKSAISN